jgi:Mrp family chromosome partitioning ATPase
VVAAYRTVEVNSQTRLLKAAIVGVGREVRALRVPAEAASASSPATATKGATIPAVETEYAQALAQQLSLRAQLAIPQSGTSTVAVATIANVEPSRVTSVAALGAGLGALLAILLAVVREQSIGRISKARDVSRVTAGSFLAQLPPGGGIGRTSARAGFRADQRFEEGLRRLRVKLTLQLPMTPHRIVIASADPREGRSYVAINLARSWALSGRSVLLAESDFRKPDLVTALKVESANPGLSDILQRMHADEKGLALRTEQRASRTTEGLRSAESLTQEILAAVSMTSTPNLSVMPAGTVDEQSINLWEGTGVKHLFDQLSEMWDIVIFDTGSLLAHSEGLILSRFADATVLLARIGRTRRNRFSAAYDMLLTSGTSAIFPVTTFDRGPSVAPSDDSLYRDAVDASGRIPLTQ